MTDKERLYIRGEMEAALIRSRLTKKQVAAKTGIPYSTVARRFKEPETMPLGELLRIGKVTGLQITIGGTHDTR